MNTTPGHSASRIRTGIIIMLFLFVLENLFLHPNDYGKSDEQTLIFVNDFTLMAAATAQLVSVRLMVERLPLAPGLISDLARRGEALRKIFYAHIPLRPRSLPFAITKADEKLANKTQKRCCVGVVRQTQSAWFIRANDFILYATGLRASPIAYL